MLILLFLTDDCTDAVNCVEYLLTERQANVDELCTYSDDPAERVYGVNVCYVMMGTKEFTSQTALHLAALRGLPKLMKCLMEHKADPFLQNSLEQNVMLLLSKRMRKCSPSNRNGLGKIFTSNVLCCS